MKQSKKPEVIAALFRLCIGSARVMEVLSEGDKIVIRFDNGYNLECGAGFRLYASESAKALEPRAVGPPE
jgi:hypothetical protein